VRGILGWLAKVANPAVSREQALDIARRECERRGLPWQEPVRVMSELADWAVWTHADHRGGNVRVIVDKGTGEVHRVSGPILR